MQKQIEINIYRCMYLHGIFVKWAIIS